MKTQHTSLLRVLTFTLLMAATLFSPAQAKTLTVALDISRSNPLFENSALNGLAANYIHSQVKSLAINDVVSLRYVGSLNDTKSVQKIEKTITHNNKEIVTAMASQMVLGVAKHVKAHDSTNLLAFFNRNQFDCQSGGDITILTDGIEASEYVAPKKLLSGEIGLPKPSEFVKLKGCTVTFYGMGAMRSDAELNRLRHQWYTFFKAAGATFKAIVL